MSEECLHSASTSNSSYSIKCALALRPVGDGHPRAVHHGIRQQKFLLVAVDYFTKWVEVEPLAKINDVVCKSIVCRFGLPRTLIIDNGHQFTGKKFGEFCEDLGISHHLTSVGHP